MALYKYRLCFFITFMDANNNKFTQKSSSIEITC